jgi:hypothetical protein
MIPALTMNDDCHREEQKQGKPQDLLLASCWTIIPDNAASHCPIKRVQLERKSEKDILLDGRWNTVASSSLVANHKITRWSTASTNLPHQLSLNQQLRRSVSANVMAPARAARIDYLVSPKRRTSMNREQLGAHLALINIED